MVNWPVHVPDIKPVCPATRLPIGLTQVAWIIFRDRAAPKSKHNPCSLSPDRRVRLGVIHLEAIWLLGHNDVEGCAWWPTAAGADLLRLNDRPGCSLFRRRGFESLRGQPQAVYSSSLLRCLAAQPRKGSFLHDTLLLMHLLHRIEEVLFTWQHLRLERA